MKWFDDLLISTRWLLTNQNNVELMWSAPNKEGWTTLQLWDGGELLKRMRVRPTSDQHRGVNIFEAELFRYGDPTWVYGSAQDQLLASLLLSY